MKHLTLIIFIIMTSFLSDGTMAQSIKLPKPDLNGEMTLMQALNERSSHREFSANELTMDHLSGLLWAACGINRTESGKRTAPSAHNWQDVQVYVFLNSGIYLYNEKSHSLEFILEGNHQAAAGLQDFVPTAPVNLVYVADYAQMEGTDTSRLEFYGGINTGFISQNVYLYCASQQLNTVVRAMVDREALHELMKLRPEQHVVVAQSVGYKP
ncbi:MAG: SagB/ThcOx family dehydrogenase [Lentimicrobium sp.]|jgi:SagB-type dehydrogenase family enzyme|nr:SagB/ThcOx family dehydrogenase [Lentimicrobium sp.]